MSIQIIGGSGFLGTFLGDQLKEDKIDFSILDSSPRGPYLEKTSYCDVKDIESLRNNLTSDLLINLAAVHRDDIEPKSLYDEVNVQGARNICQVAREKSIKSIIFISSVAIYGNSGEIKDENAPINYFNDYGRTKHEAENIFQDWFEEDNQRTLIIIRPTVIFGPGNRGNIFNLLNQIYSKQFLMIGKGKNVKSICYVKNVASFISYCLKLTPGIHVFNYIDKPDLSMNELVFLTKETLNRSKRVLRIPEYAGLVIGKIVDIFSRLVGKSFNISFIRIKKFISTSEFDTCIPNKTDFRPPFAIRDSLIETIKYEFIEDNSAKEVFETE